MNLLQMDSIDLMILTGDIGQNLNNAVPTLKRWGGALIMVLGVIGIVWAIFQVWNGLRSDQARVNWFKVLIFGAISGAMLALGWNFANSAASSIGNTVQNLFGF